jgi:putative membrane protein
MKRSTLAVVALVLAPSLAFAGTRLINDAGAHTPAEPVIQGTLDDPTIVAIFDAANTADIETGTLAAERGHSKEVRDFGAMLARDHKQVRQLGRDLAQKLGVTPTPPRNDKSAADHAATMKRLRGLSGADFDHAFLQYEVTFHQTVIDAVNSTLLPAIKNAELKALVVKVAPAFEAHRLAAGNLDKKLSTAGDR